jgi:hypothetical protein
MNELRERFDVIVSELIASYRNIHYENIDTKERIGCLVGRAQTIAISLMEQYNDTHTQEESMFLVDEFMGLLSDNTELNELKFDAYVKYRRLHLGYLSDIKTARKVINIRRKIDTISGIRKELNVSLQGFAISLPKTYADIIRKIRIYIDKLTVIMDEYAKLLPSNTRGQNTRGQNNRRVTNRRATNREVMNRKVPNATKAKLLQLNAPKLNATKAVPTNPAHTKPPSPKPVPVKTQVPVKTPVLKTPVPLKPHANKPSTKTAKKPPLNMKQELNKLKEYAKNKLIEFDTKEHSKKEIKRIYDKIVDHHVKLVSKNEYLNSLDTPLHAEYVKILEEIEFSMLKIKSLLD